MSRSKVRFSDEISNDVGRPKTAFADKSISSLKASIAAFHQSQAKESSPKESEVKESNSHFHESEASISLFHESEDSLKASIAAFHQSQAKESSPKESEVKESIARFHESEVKESSSKESEPHESISSTVAVNHVRNPRMSRIGVIPLNINTRKVKFEKQVDAHPSLSKKDMTPEEIEAYWSTKSDDKKAFMHAKKTVLMIMKGMSFDDKENCSRGLECKVQAESRRRVAIKKTARAELKKEQELQQLSGVSKPDKLAKVVIKVTKELVDDAAKIAVQDAKEAYAYLADTRAYMEYLAKREAAGKKVDFNKQIDTHPSLSKKDMTPEEREKYWCTKNDDKQCYMQAKTTVLMIMKGMSFDDVENCSRGLENRTRDGLKKKIENKKKVTAALMSEQKIQQLGGDKNPEKLASAVMKLTKDLASSAAEIGIKDERDVQEYLQDTRQYVQSLSTESPASSE